MKVLIEAQSIVKTRSGIGWYTYNIINELLKLKRDNLSILGTAFDFIGRNNAKETLEKAGFEETEIEKLLPYKIYKLLWNIVPTPYNSLFSKSDIYHFFNFIVPPISKGKIITTIHDVAFKLYPDTLRNSNLYFLNREIEKTINRADIIVTVSESAKRDVITYLNVDEAKIRIIKNATDWKFYSKGRDIDKETSSKIRAKYGLPSKYILYLGTIEPRKNIAGIFEAFSLLPIGVRREVKLVIAGGKGWKCDGILDIPNKLDISRDVFYTGYIDEGDKPYIYGLADMFLFPSFYEGFGVPVLEAMAAGVPVITSNCSSLPEVGGEAALYVDPKDSDEIAQNVMLLLSDANLRNEKKMLGYQQVQQFNWKTSAEKAVEIYNELI